MIEDKKERRPDIVLFVNGLPLVVVELKNPGAVQASLRSGSINFRPTRKKSRRLFAYNELLIISDGMQARFGTLTTAGTASCPGAPSTAPTFIVSRATKSRARASSKRG